MSQDMTKGSVSRSLIMFALPLMLSSLFQQLYTWGDALIVGNFVGEGALAAIGSTGAVSRILLTVLTGFSVGISILTSQTYGGNERDRVGGILSLFVTILGIAGFCIAFTGFFILSPLLRLMKTPADIFTDAVAYLRVILIGLPFMGVYNVYSAVLRGVALYAVIVSTLSDTVLNILMVGVMGMGIGGASYSTIITQILMTIFVVIYTSRKHPELRLRFGRTIFDRTLLTKGLRLSVPTATQSMLRSFGMMLFQSIVNSFGSSTVAAIATAYRLDSIGLLPLTGLGSGVTNFVAQNTGADKPERAREGFKTGAKLACAVSVFITAGVYFLGEGLLGLFGISQEVIDIGQGLILRLSAFYSLFGLVHCLVGYMQGVGEVTFTSIVSISSLFASIVFARLLAPTVGNMIIAWSEVLTWFLQVFIFGWKYRQIGKRAVIAQQ